VGNSEFVALEPDSPATLENVVVAISALRQFDEAEVAELVSAGRLRAVFPFSVPNQTLPPDAEDLDTIVAASAAPLSEAAYARVLRASLPARGAGPLRDELTRTVDAEKTRSSPSMSGVLLRKNRLAFGVVLLAALSGSILTAYLASGGVGSSTDSLQLFGAIVAVMCNVLSGVFAVKTILDTSRRIEETYKDIAARIQAKALPLGSQGPTSKARS
jgi:hypothetical protein